LESTASDLSRLESELFEAIHQQQRPLADLDQLAAWAAEHGVDALKFRAAFTSSEVTAKATRADQLSRDYMIRAVPTLAVDGKYLVLGASFEQMLKNARQLIDKIAAQREAPGS
jgi:thiol:disulfide interchange protein DsbA